MHGFYQQIHFICVYHSYIRSRKFSFPKRSAVIIVMFRYELCLASWDIIQHENDPNCVWDLWKEMSLKISDAHAPVRKGNTK